MYQVDQIDQHGYNQPARFCMRLSLVAGIATINNHCLLQWIGRRDSPVNTICVDGEIEQISFLQESNALRVGPAEVLLSDFPLRATLVELSFKHY